VPHGDVQDYYSLLDVCPFPRKAWPVCEMVSPMKPLEALAMEKAVLVSSVGALAGMIADGSTGLIFEKGDVADMAEKLKRLMTDAALRQELGGRGRDWVKRERTWSSTGALAGPVLERLRQQKTLATGAAD
jgi:glycosyltransferase involved in cell wall biosynthesis